MNATWSLRVENRDGTVTEQEGALDSFTELIGNGLAKVSMSTTFGIDYASVKVTSSVTVTCNQDESTINIAAERAFMKTLELARDGMTHAIPAREGLLKEAYGGG